MATSQQLLAAPPLAPPGAGALERPLPKALLPSFADCFFIALIIWTFAAGPHGWDALLGDADIGWHIRTGDWILAHHTVPGHDLFSFSKPDAPWFAWEWLSDIVFALLFRAAGLKGVALFAGAVIAVYSTIVLRHAFWRGANVIVALPVVLLGVGASSVHFLARPHIFTFLFLALAFWALDVDRRENTRCVWLLVPLSVVWVNLHGGFFIFLACLALLAVGCAMEAAWGVRRWAAMRRYSLLWAACGAASLINPYGIKLHLHVMEYLRSGWIRDNVQEFLAPSFRGEGELQFEAILIGGLLVAALLIQARRLSEALWIVFLAHSALTSLRHAPLFCVAAVPLIAGELSSLWNGVAWKLPRRSLLATLHDMGRDLAPPFRRNTVWMPAVIVVLALAPLNWPRDFPKDLFPGALIARHAQRLSTARVLTTDQWADYLIFRNYPQQRVYLDGRSDFYGETLGKEYLGVLQLSSGWRNTMERRRFDAVLLPPRWPLVEMLKRSPEWRISDDDGTAILFLRGDKGAPQAPLSHSPQAVFVLKKNRAEPNENLQPRRSLYTGERRNARG